MSFEKCPNESFDVSVMEKTNKGIVIPLNCGWNDIGSWNAVWQNSKKDDEGNYIQGKIITERTRNSYLRSESRLLVGIGLEDLVVVETNDAILVADKNESQRVQKYCQKVKRKKY